MRPFYQLHCDDLEIIQKKVLDFLQEKTDVLVRSADKNFSWNFFEARDLLLSVPELREWFKSQGLILRDVAATVTRTVDGLEPHRDQPPIVAKINFPILNTENTYNVWWDDEGNEIARITMLQPVVFNASMMHAVEIGPGATYPRIVLSCMFFKEPTHLEKD